MLLRDEIENEAQLRVRSLLKPEVARCRPRLNVDVAGGGPVGLLFATVLKVLLGALVRIRVFDPRWCGMDSRIRWKGPQHGNNRRQQVVTLQSKVWSSLPVRIQNALFEQGEYSCMWPNGPDSPSEIGLPRNIPIRCIEDRLLIFTRETDIELIPEAYDPSAELSNADVLAVCDGPTSPTREYLREYFGSSDRSFYSLGGRQMEEVVIGMQVESELVDSEAVILTIMQNRYLYNGFRGRGFINMRLTPEEAREVMAISDSGFASCIQSQPCLMKRERDRFRCATHGALFRPSMDSLSFLWPRMLQGLRLFGMGSDRLLAVTAFRLTLEHRSRFTASVPGGPFACLLGDAANALHFWPGRGLNTGFKSAVSLARSLVSTWNGRSLREADFARHEALMHMLQYREKTVRAWRTMLMPDERGYPKPIDIRIRAGLRGPYDARRDREILMERMRVIRTRLEGRMADLPTDAILLRALMGLDEATLKVMVETGPWITAEVGGAEVDVDDFFPNPESAPQAPRQSAV